MAPKCRHIMPSGRQCHGYALQGEDLCYFHSRRRLAAAKPADSIEIPLLEERCVIQVVITQALRAIANNTIDRPRASLLLYGLQLALQSVDRKEDAIPFGSVEAISETSDGEELAADPYDEDEEDEDDEEDSDESSDDSGGEVDEGSDDDEQDEKDSDDDSEEERDDDDEEEEAGDGLDNETTGELIAGQKYLESVSNALDSRRYAPRRAPAQRVKPIAATRRRWAHGRYLTPAGQRPGAGEAKARQRFR